MNKTKLINTLPRHAAVALAALVLSACAMTPKDEGQYVIDRAQERWDAIISGELETAYTFYSPGYRSTHSLIDFGVQERTRRIKYTSATYLSHECDGSRCVITFDVGYRVGAPVPGISYFDGSNRTEDTWINTGGDWWYLPQN